MLQSLEAPLQYSWNKRHDRFLEEFYNWMETRWSGELIHWGNATATGHDAMRLPFRKMLPATPYLDPNPDGEVFETPRCLFHGTSSTRLLAILTACRLIRGARCCTKNGISRYGVSCTESEATALLYAYPAPLPSSEKCRPRMKIQCVLESKAYRATKVTHGERPKTYIMKEPWLQLEALHITLWHADAPHRDTDFCSHPDAEEMKACQYACEWNDFSWTGIRSRRSQCIQRYQERQLVHAHGQSDLTALPHQNNMWLRHGEAPRPCRLVLAAMTLIGPRAALWRFVIHLLAFLVPTQLVQNAK